MMVTEEVLLQIMRELIGSFAANYAGANLWKNLRSNSEFKEGRFIEALTRGFHETDSKLRAG
jgi:hypothetical protein